MKQYFLLFWWIIYFMLVAQFCTAQKFIKIDRGIIKGDFTITINSKYVRNKEHLEIPLLKSITIRPDTFFNLQQLGLESFNNVLGTNANDQKLSAQWAIYYKVYKHLPTITDEVLYNITINRNGKVYYGKMVFFNAYKAWSKNDAVTSYYEIKIADKYFQEAKGGKVSHV